MNGIYLGVSGGTRGITGPELNELGVFTSPQGRNSVPLHKTRGKQPCSDLAIFSLDLQRRKYSKRG